MNSRVTTAAFTRNAIHFSSLHNSRLLSSQKQITSGLRFQNASEEPIDYRRIRAFKTEYVKLQTDKQSIELATSTLNASVAQLQDAGELVSYAKTLVQRGIQALDDDEKLSLSTEIDALLEQAKAIGLTKFNGNYLYGGTRSVDPPFQFDKPIYENGLPQSTYNGTSQRSQTFIGESISIDTFYSGKEIFGASGRQSTLLVGTTGATLGGGTDTVVGRATLEVRHTSTSYFGLSGIATGVSSATGDTVIGNIGVHEVTVDDTSGTGAFGTISLNGGDPIPFTNADTNLEVKGRDGQVIYVDTTNITAGFSGTVNLQGTGTLSIDEGATTVPVGFASQQVLTDSATGRTVTIDSTSISSAGDDSLEFPGTSDLFQILSATADDLRNERGLSNAAASAALDRRWTELDLAASQIYDAMGQQSTSLKTMQTMESRVDDLMLSTETSIAEVQGTDFPDAVIKMQNAQTLLQYTYAVTANISSLGLLEFLG
ncbi:hypothetical protein LOC67_20570 [Stieleria sp. JC731]|uniref:flagellin N-terminal helical domain-containing protein n=1 Tax=Pirellulaceae TaxID=2691357 RepID=UPI001E581677|nr:hypothetical protein [Stieleria sp. JC731]MCC9602951.1 hypothetical protein [Stieleria sp. JC731]